MKKAIAVSATAFSLVSPAAAQFTNPQLPDLTSPIYLECEIVSQESQEKNDSDPVYKITIYLEFEDSGKATAMTVRHTTVTGKTYGRSDQYKDNVTLTQIDGKTEWLWSGSQKNTSTLGRLIRNTQGEWYYEEALFRGADVTTPLLSHAPPRYRMTARCHTFVPIDAP